MSAEFLSKLSTIELAEQVRLARDEAATISNLDQLRSVLLRAEIAQWELAMRSPLSRDGLALRLGVENARAERSVAERDNDHDAAHAAQLRMLRCLNALCELAEQHARSPKGREEDEQRRLDAIAPLVSPAILRAMQGLPAQQSLLDQQAATASTPATGRRSSRRSERRAERAPSTTRKKTTQSSWVSSLDDALSLFS